MNWMIFGYKNKIDLNVIILLSKYDNKKDFSNEFLEYRKNKVTTDSVSKHDGYDINEILEKHLLCEMENDDVVDYIWDRKKLLLRKLRKLKMKKII